MARRGGELHEHILWTAKDVFLELGFERTSMAIVARRAETSKRSLYAHFESKETLFLAVIELVRGLFLSRLGRPGDYPGQPAEALMIFCGRYLETLLFEGSIQMFRLSASETARFPAGAVEYFDVIFTEVESRISEYLAATFASSPALGEELAKQILGQILYPSLPRALFGMDRLTKTLDDNASPGFDSSHIRNAVTEAMSVLERYSAS